MEFNSIYLALFVALSTGSNQSAPIDSRTIAANYAQARGGMEKINSIRSVIFRGAPRANGRPGRYMAKARPQYFRVGDPAAPGSFAEGFDGSAWEYYADPGLVMRTEAAPAAASSHTGYFDDPIIKSITDNWSLELLGSETVGEHQTYRLLSTYPDGLKVEFFMDKTTWLMVANRKSAPIHASGNAVATETRIEAWKEAGGVLFPSRLREYVIATGQAGGQRAGLSCFFGSTFWPWSRLSISGQRGRSKKGIRGSCPSRSIE